MPLGPIGTGAGTTAKSSSAVGLAERLPFGTTASNVQEYWSPTSSGVVGVYDVVVPDSEALKAWNPVVASVTVNS